MERLTELWEKYRYPLLIGLVVIMAVGSWLLNNTAKPTEDQLSMTSSSQHTSVVSSSPTVNSRGPVWIDVKGAVKTPGLYRLKSGARVNEALQAAGGPLANADMRQVNLAKQLSDQQVVYVPRQGEEVPASVGSTTGESNSSTDSGPVVNLNTATKEQLCQITGIGDKKADLILQYREQHGQFKSVDELTQINGFGEKTVAKIKDQLAV